MAKTLIAFFSRRGENWVGGSIRNLPKGNNEVIVEKIKALLPQADVFRIDTVKKYADDYMVCIEEAKQELRAKARPELTARVEVMDQYDTIILGYPNWWGIPPMAVFTFLESYDFAGKKIVPFCSHEGSGLGGSIRQLSEAGIDAIEISANGTSVPGVKAGKNEAYFREYAEALKRVVSTPVILVGGHRSIESMNTLLNETDIEYLSLSRPLIREPNLIKRWMDGDTRPALCVSCNSCYRTPGHACIFKLRGM